MSNQTDSKVFLLVWPGCQQIQSTLALAGSNQEANSLLVATRLFSARRAGVTRAALVVSSELFRRGVRRVVVKPIRYGNRGGRMVV